MSAGSSDELKAREKSIQSKLGNQGSLKARTIAKYLKNYRGAFVLTISNEFLVHLKNLPENVLSKVQETYARGLTSYFTNHQQSSDNNSSKSPEKNVTPGKDNVLNTTVESSAASAEKFTIDNNGASRTADPKITVKTEGTNNKPDTTILENQKKLHKKEQVTVESNKFLEWNQHWENVEARTRYLVSVIQKNYNSSSTVHLKQHLDDLFDHIYQYHETRNCAIEAGALKILFKISKSETYESPILHRTRELLALLGYNPPTKGRGIKILAIDGGGVRGLVALEVLRVIERVTGKRTHELFDYICGVSTGSILGFLLGARKLSLDECELLYKDLSREIFGQNSFFGNAALVWSHAYYHTPTFERILKEHCGEGPLIALARDPLLPRVSAISTIVSLERVAPYVFRTYALPPTVPSRYFGGCRYNIWEAVRASAAAPTYFEEFKLGNYLHQDGGVLLNNPTSVAISEARTIWKNAPLQCVVSLGTGLTLSSRTDKNLEDLMSADGGIRSLSWKGKFLKVLDSATDTESVHNTLNELLPHDIYFRLNPYLSDVVRLDEASNEKLEQVQTETRDYLHRNHEKVNFLCKSLLREKSLTKRLSDWWNY